MMARGGADADADLTAVRDAVHLTRGTNTRARHFALLDGDLGDEVFPGPDADIDQYIRRGAWGHHASCSNPMGPPGDRASVVDPRFDGLPSVVATVIVLQRLEGLSDREALDRFTFDARWRYAAAVGGWDGAGATGFAHTVLVDMRERLRRSDRVFEVALTAAEQAGLVGRRRVLDSTPLYDTVATMDTVTLIRWARDGYALPLTLDGNRPQRLSVFTRRRERGIGGAPYPVHQLPIGHRRQGCSLPL